MRSPGRPNKTRNGGRIPHGLTLVQCLTKRLSAMAGKQAYWGSRGRRR